MYHENYVELEAESYFELGVLLGERFRDSFHELLAWLKEDADWSSDLTQARAYLAATEQAFPHLIDELRGYAEGVGASLEEVWMLALEDELDDEDTEKCTSIVTNQGRLLAHNEDWDVEAKDLICVLKKKIKDLTILELYYPHTLGGSSISVSSRGYVQMINSLSHRDYQMGIPKVAVARWLSETSDPEADYQVLTQMKRSSGYHHTLVRVDGRVWSIECSAAKQKLLRPSLPFVHTNHYLSSLNYLEEENDDWGTFSRYERARALVSSSCSVNQLKVLMCDQVDGSKKSIFNETTIARMIVDLEAWQAHVWMLREDEKGWLPYDLSFVLEGFY